ncbi:MAG: 3-deoxy-7-phosphoheptulonate synthase class II [Verrucomicrobiota bacterium]
MSKQTPNSAMGGPWSPASWQQKVAAQQPVYPNQPALQEVLGQLARLPPLVSSWEVENLKQQLAAATRGECFLLQGGDCSETFADCESGSIVKKLKILLQMSLVLMQGAKKRVVRVGRFAGQYAKPRSSDMETKDGVTLPSFRGDLVNRPGFTLEDRQPNPELLLRAYERSGLTINFIRALVDGGFADLHHPEYWDLGFVSRSPQASEYMKMMESLCESLRFMETLMGGQISDISRMDFFTSHEALVLHYEQAQTRIPPRRAGWYNLATHFPWIGERTRDLQGAHIEYFRGLENPIGVKLGPSVTPNDAVRLSEVLNPRNEAGHLTFIHRFGAANAGRCLPPLVRAITHAERRVLWCCDPMHGNTETVQGGIKTRRFEKILLELETSFNVLRDEGAHLGGVHIELTGENVTECLGGASGITESDLTRDYRSPVDPRLNYEQAMEMAFLLARLMAQNRK